MKRNHFLLLLNAASAAIIAQSPITLGNNNMPGSGDTLRYTNFQVNTAGNYTQTGPNFNWDFSQVTSTTQGLRSFRSSLQTPYALFFLGFNEYGEKVADTLGFGPIVLTQYYDFYKKQTSPVNAFISDGLGMTFSGVPVPSYFTDKDELYIFPMTYPKYDSTSFRFTTSLGGFIPATYMKSGYRVTVVDGWGTIKTPYGTENCLRLITTQYATDSIKSSLVPVPLGFPNYQRSYQWLTLNAKIPFLEITGTLLGGTFTPVTARYRGYAKEGGVTVALQEEQFAEQNIVAYPNPVKQELRLKGKVAGASCALYDAQGRFLKTMDQAPAATLNVSELAPGAYFLKVSQDGKDTFVKFIKD